MSWALHGDMLNIIDDGRIRWNKPLFMEITLLASWNIWRERNTMHFQGVPPTVISWKAILKSDLLLLIHRTKSSLHCHILDLVASL
jgi:hypothetical protein